MPHFNVRHILSHVATAANASPTAFVQQQQNNKRSCDSKKCLLTQSTDDFEIENLGASTEATQFIKSQTNSKCVVLSIDYEMRTCNN